MGFFSDIKAIGSVQKIKNGGTAKLSISQITGLIINLPDARNNLPANKFNQVYELFNKLRTCNTKMELDYNGYLQQAVDIIKRFDAIAPYEKYSGGNEVEFSFLMEDIRAEGNTYNTATDDFIDNEKEQYAKQLVQQSNEMIALEDAKQFVDILLRYSVYGKNDCLDAFDVFVDNIVKKYGAIPSIKIVSFFMGALNANGIITQTELDSMSKNFTNELIKNSFPNQ